MNVEVSSDRRHRQDPKRSDATATASRVKDLPEKLRGLIQATARDPEPVGVTVSRVLAIRCPMASRKFLLTSRPTPGLLRWQRRQPFGRIWTGGVLQHLRLPQLRVARPVRVRRRPCVRLLPVRLQVSGSP